MKRFHVHVGVADLEASMRFYSTLFAAEPDVRNLDDAKWMLDNPRVNFAMSQRRGPVGLHHLGIQAEDIAELGEVCERLERANRPTLEEGKTVCCYAKSDQSWISDPQGIMWETFLTLGESTDYGGNAPAISSEESTGSLVPSCGCGPVKVG
jgi:catechol 2,3-dioxygenase-like lactoylglutathione lyase family enzyme